MTPTLPSQAQRPVIAREWWVMVLVISISAAMSWLALREFRASGVRPFFYQSNFEPAVTLACGQGFGVVQPAVPELTRFLNVEVDTFDCALLEAREAAPLVSAAHANWYYLYGASAAVWRVTGVSWVALDGLVALLAGFVAAALYGLFRLVTSRGAAAVLTVIMVLSPANLTPMLSLRDYSKAPFVLGALLILAVLIRRPMTNVATWSLAAGYGALVALGYGFRADLAVMAPIGFAIVAGFLPGAFRRHAVRNLVAAVILAASFIVVGWPVLSALKLGGCQYHFALLGLTSPLTTELRLTPSLYRFGDHLTDTFVDLKVGDFATRVRNEPVPSLCNAAYDAASGQMYMALATTFPADLVARAYGSVLGILRAGLVIPEMMQPAPPFASSPAMAMIYGAASRVSTAIAPAGPILTLAAMVVAWAHSMRAGLAFTALVLFLCGYPAIQFEARHWFHLRFIPWWAGALVVTALLSWRTERPERGAIIRGVAAAALVVVSLAVALAVVRAGQGRSAAALIAQYESLATTPVVMAPAAGAFVPVEWRPEGIGDGFQQRASDLLVVTLDAAACAGSGPMAIKVVYRADLPSHDLTNVIPIERPNASAPPTRLFIPVFRAGLHQQVFLEFTGLEVVGAPAACIGSVAVAADRGAVPLWLQAWVPADWRDRALYETMQPPRMFQR